MARIGWCAVGAILFAVSAANAEEPRLRVELRLDGGTPPAEVVGQETVDAPLDPYAVPDQALHANSPVFIADLGAPIPDPGDFLFCRGESATATSTVFDQETGERRPGVLVTLTCTPELSFAPTPGTTSTSGITDANGQFSAVAYAVAGATEAKVVELRSIVPNTVFVGKNPLLGTVVAVEEPPTLEMFADPVTGESTLQPGDTLAVTGRTKPPQFEALIRWTFERSPDASFVIGNFSAQRTPQRVVVTANMPGSYTVKAACRFADPGQRTAFSVAPHQVRFLSATSQYLESASLPLIDVQLHGGRILPGIGIPVTVEVVDAGGTATAGVDYLAFGRTTATIPQGAGFGAVLRLIFPLRNDSPAVSETDELVNMRMENPSTNATLGAPVDHALTIIDDDVIVSFLLAESVPVNEADSDPALARQIKITVENKSGHPVPGAFTSLTILSSGVPSRGADYALSQSSFFLLTAPTNETLSFTLSSLQDNLVEGEEIAFLSISSSTGNVEFRTPILHTVSILDDDVALIGFAASTSTVAEPPGNPDGPGSAQTRQVVLALPSGSMLASPVQAQVTLAGSTADLRLATLSVEFPVGSESGATRTINFDVLPDRLIEGPEVHTLILAADAGSPAVVAPTAPSHAVSVTDDEAAAVVRFLATSSTTREGVAVSVLAELIYADGQSPPLQLAAPVTAEVSATSDTPGDFTLSSTVYEFSAGTASGSTGSIIVSPASDNIAEETEVITLSLAAQDGPIAIGLPGSHAVTVLDGGQQQQVDYMLIGPKPVVALPYQEVEVTAFGVFNGENGVRDTAADGDPFALDGDDVLVGPIEANWSLQAEGAKLVSPSSGVFTARISAGGQGGVFRSAIRATAGVTRGRAQDQATLIIPWIERVEISDPHDIHGSHIHQIETRGGDQTPSGIAIFPDRLTPNSEVRNRALILAVVQPTEAREQLLGTQVYFRSIDVDDRDTSEVGNRPADLPIDLTDTPGQADNRKQVVPTLFDPADDGRLSADSGAIISEQDESGNDTGRLVATVELTVSFSPGDNYRVVSTMVPEFRLGDGREFELDAPSADWDDQAEENAQKGRVRIAGPTDVIPTPITIRESVVDAERFSFLATQVITVWRVVHVEIDAMMPVDPAARQAFGVLQNGTVTKVENPVGQGQDRVVQVRVERLAPGFQEATEEDPEDPDRNGALAEGFLDVVGGQGQTLSIANLRVVDDTTALVDVRVGGAALPRVGQEVRLRDDDDDTLLAVEAVDRTVADIKRILPDWRTHREASYTRPVPTTFVRGGPISRRPLENFTPVNNVYASAYIVCVYDGGEGGPGASPNNQIGDPAEDGQRAPFFLHLLDLNGPNLDYLKSIWQSRTHDGDPAFMVAHLLLGFQPGFQRDRDPRGHELDPTHVGATATGRGTCVIFLETNRESLTNPSKGTAEGAIREDLSATWAHELWHSLTTLDDGFGETVDGSSGDGIMGTAGNTNSHNLVSLGRDQDERLYPLDVINLRRIVERYALRINSGD